MAEARPARVRLVAVPVELVERTRLHYDSLRRELTFIALSSPESKRSVPPDLLALVDRLAVVYTTITPRQANDLGTARSRGDTGVDLEVDVMPGAGDASAELAVLLDEADEFCRAGKLLTLPTPPECVTFRRWYLGEFTRQLAGQPPTPWPEWGRAHAPR
jgi:hypothetical protein